MYLFSFESIDLFIDLFSFSAVYLPHLNIFIYVLTCSFIEMRLFYSTFIYWLILLFLFSGMYLSHSNIFIYLPPCLFIYLFFSSFLFIGMRWFDQNFFYFLLCLFIWLIYWNAHAIRFLKKFIYAFVYLFDLFTVHFYLLRCVRFIWMDWIDFVCLFVYWLCFRLVT